MSLDGQISNYNPNFVIGRGGRVLGIRDPSGTDFALLTSNNDKGALAAQMRFERLLEQNGAVFDGVSDDQPGLQAAVNAMPRSGYIQELRLPYGANGMKINSMLEIDISKLAVDLRWAKIDASGFTGTTEAIRLTGTEETLTNVMGRNKMGFVRNFELVGSGEANTNLGINLQGVSTDLGPGPSRAVVSGFLIHNFGTGIQHHHHAYAECLIHGDVNNCGTAVLYNPAGTSKDMGEQTKYFDVVIYQCLNWAVQNQGVHGTWLKFIACHFDHNQRQVLQMNRGRTMLIASHVEAGNYQLPPFKLDSTGGLIESDAQTEHVVTDASPTMPFYVENNAPRNGHHGVFFKGRPNLYKVKTATGYFGTGVGLTRFTEGFTSNVDIASAAVRNPKFLSANISEKTVPDRGFDAATLLRRLQITQDTAGITNPVTGANIALVRSTAAPRSVTFQAGISGNTLTYATGTRPYVGHTLSGSGVTACSVTGTGVTSAEYKVSVSQTVSAGTTITGVGVAHLRATKAGAAATVAEFWVPMGKVRSLNSRGTFGAWFNKSAAGNVLIKPGYASFAETGSGNRVMLSFTASEPTQTLSATSTWTRIESPDAGVAAAEIDQLAEEYGFLVDATAMAAGTIDIDDDEASVM